MRHHNVIKKFGRVSNKRLALVRSLARSLVIHERIETTEAKAKALRPFIEKLITKGKNDTLATRRLLISRLGGDEESVKKIIEDLSPRYKERNGGYTRVTKVHAARKDAADMAVIEFV